MRNLEVFKNSIAIKRAAPGFWNKCSALYLSILHVVTLCANKQMLWVNALWVIASMANKQILAYFSVVNFIRNSMGMAKFRINGKTPVAFRIFSCCPNPASLGLINFIPKPLENFR